MISKDIYFITSTFLVLIFVSGLSVKNVNSKIAYAVYENTGDIKIYEGNVSESNIETNRWTAKGVFKNTVNKSGFASLEIETNILDSDLNQSYTAGVLESYFLGELIYSHWYNIVKDFRDTMNKDVILKIDKFLEKNSKWIHKQLQHKNDAYWHQVRLFYNQVNGIYNGYNKYWSKKFQKLEWNDILWLNMFYDIMDLYTALGGDKTVGNGHCSVLIKIMPNFSDIYVGHNTWASYQNMLRVMKKFTLHYNATKDVDKIIPGKQVTFSSYPGVVGSQDDFYLISSGLAVIETTNEMFNETLWLNSLSPENEVLESVRSVVANRLANSGNSWSNINSLYNSGTYNNQWMIFDYKKFKPGRPPLKDAFWVIEQAPTKSVSGDLTQILITKGYWSSYNIPYYPEIYDVMDYASMQKKYGNWFSHENAPRAKIFERDHVKVHDMDSFMDLMRSNNYRTEPYARCQCNPPYSAAGAIAARDDLNPANGTFQFKAQSHRPYGAIDAKITNSVYLLNLEFIAVSGPTSGTNGLLPMFKWSTSDFTETPHMLHPDVWNFSPVFIIWSNR